MLLDHLAHEARDKTCLLSRNMLSCSHTFFHHLAAVVGIKQTWVNQAQSCERPMPCYGYASYYNE